jgi:hypothetical protein
MNNIFIREMKMPLTIRAFTLPDANGDFNIYINDELSDEAKRKSFEHEKAHIINNDFFSGETARTIEAAMKLRTKNG